MPTTTDMISGETTIAPVNKRAEALAKARAAKAAKKVLADDDVVEVSAEVVESFLNAKPAKNKRFSADDLDVWLRSLHVAMQTMGCNHPRKLIDVLPLADEVLKAYNIRKNEVA